MVPNPAPKCCEIHWRWRIEDSSGALMTAWAKFVSPGSIMHQRHTGEQA
jgi:hypothetical protein